MQKLGNMYKTNSLPLHKAWAHQREDSSRLKEMEEPWQKHAFNWIIIYI